MKIDGVDHINAYSQGKTTLGRWLSNFYECDIVNAYGKFRSIENLWQWLKYEEPMLRDCEPYRAKTTPKKKGWRSKRKGAYQDAMSRQLIIDAMVQKFKSNPYMMGLFIDNKLPVLHYYQGCSVNDTRFVDMLMEAKEKYIASLDNTN